MFILRILWKMTAYALGIFMMLVLFGAGSVPVTRGHDNQVMIGRKTPPSPVSETEPARNVVFRQIQVLSERMIGLNPPQSDYERSRKSQLEQLRARIDRENRAREARINATSVTTGTYNFLPGTPVEAR